DGPPRLERHPGVRPRVGPDDGAWRGGAGAAKLAASVADAAPTSPLLGAGARHRRDALLRRRQHRHDRVEVHLLQFLMRPLRVRTLIIVLLLGALVTHLAWSTA